MNTITISGHLGRDAETRSTASGKRVASASLAVSQGKDKPTLWLTIDAWEGQWAFDRLSTARKGQGLVITGRLTMREWTTDDGTTRQAIGVTCSDVEWSQRADRQAAAGDSGGPRREQRQRPQAATDDEEIPF